MNPTALRYLAVIASLVLGAASALAAPLTAEDYQKAVDSAYAKFKGVKEGANADYIPILATVPSEMFGVAIVTRDGEVYSAGEMDYEFSIQSVSKPFTASLIMAEQGPKATPRPNRQSAFASTPGRRDERAR